MKLDSGVTWRVYLWVMNWGVLFFLLVFGLSGIAYGQGGEDGGDWDPDIDYFTEDGIKGDRSIPGDVNSPIDNRPNDGFVTTPSVDETYESNQVAEGRSFVWPEVKYYFLFVAGICVLLLLFSRFRVGYQDRRD